MFVFLSLHKAINTYLEPVARHISDGLFGLSMYMNIPCHSLLDTSTRDLADLFEVMYPLNTLAIVSILLRVASKSTPNQAINTLQSLT